MSFIENGRSYLQCRECGDYQVVSGENIVSTLCSRCLNRKIPIEPPKSKYMSTGRPAGWHWMKEFVDKDGNVFYRGKEQPKLKGTLPSTKVMPKKKIKRRTKNQILIDRHKKKKAALKKAVKKQQDFINHNIKK